MPTLPTILPGLGLSCTERLLLLAALSYLAVGLAYLTGTGITTTRWRRQEIGTGPAAAAATAGVMAIVLLLWPVPLICQTVRSLRRSKPCSAPEDLIWRRPPADAAAVSAAPSDRAIISPQGALSPVPPRWYREEYEAVRVALAEGRTAIARSWVSGLIDDSTIEFGPGQGDAHGLVLLAHIVRVALVERWPDTHTWSADPFEAFLFPRGHPATAGYGDDGHSVYCSAGCSLPWR